MTYQVFHKNSQILDVLKQGLLHSKIYMWQSWVAAKQQSRVAKQHLWKKEHLANSSVYSPSLFANYH